jgi:hypothetical protein
VESRRPMVGPPEVDLADPASTIRPESSRLDVPSM